MRSRIFVVGITGGIGTGKSTVSHFFEKKGCMVIDADDLSRELMQRGQPTYDKIVSQFGSEILSQDKSINRKKLADKVFHDKDSLIVLQSLLADSLEAELIEKFENLPEEKSKPFVVLEAPVLFEYGAEYLVDFVLLISAEENLQIERVSARNKISKEDVKSRIDSQLPTSEKIERADMVIENSGSIEELEIKLNVAFEEISKIAEERLA